MRIFKYVGLADYVTVCNGLLGFLAIMYIIDNNFRMAFILLLVVLILDGLDGWLARYLESSKQLGKYLDSISDTLSFSFAPAALIYTIFYDLRYTSFNYLPNTAVVFLCFIIVGFGMLRLAWFIEYGQKTEYFQGLPTPALALFVIIILQPGIQLWLDQFVTLLVILMVTVMTISDVKYPKLKDIYLAGIAGLVVVLMLIVIIFEFSGTTQYMVLSISFGLLLLYIAGGPYLVIEDEIARKIKSKKKTKNNQ